MPNRFPGRVAAIAIALAAAVAITPVLAAQTTDSVYASAALREFVARAAAGNHAPPASLDGYRARIETEMSFVLRDTLGRERATQLEQLAARADWTRAGQYDVHVVGYRSQALGSPFSALSFMRGYTVPVLYGERLYFGIEGTDTTRATPRRAGRGDPIVAVHPLARDRDRYYRYGGGDTVAVLRTTRRAIPVVRVTVTPHIDSSAPRLAVFSGEMEFDAERGALVRMRGQILIAGRSRTKPPLVDRLLSHVPGLVTAAFVEFVNAEVAGRYWLPVYQRSEFQATFAMLGDNRSVFRIISRFAGHELRETTATLAARPVGVAATGTADSAPPFRPARPRLTFAPKDSVSRYAAWQEPLGATTTSVSAGDFDDLAPDIWKPSGRPRVDPFPSRMGDVVRFDRVEGLYTGASMTVRMRDAWPGATARAWGGWAWAERTVRGGARLGFPLQRPWWTVGARAERSLASTGDFALPFEEDGASLAALLGAQDDFDYVDRRLATLTAARVLGAPDLGLATVELGAAEDRPEIARLEHGLFRQAAPFRPNRGSLAGRYLRSVAMLELHPNVSGDFLQPGAGARLRYERGDGDLAYQRAELALSARRYWHFRGDFSLAGHADGGVVWGGRGGVIPPQQIFELGGSGDLSGYRYKEFGGDRAALLRTSATYAFPILRTPIRVRSSWYAPGVAPGLRLGVAGGWAEISSAAARRAVEGLSAVGAADGASLVSRSTGGMRATLDGYVTFFGGLVGVGAARPLDHGGRWRAVARFGR